MFKKLLKLSNPTFLLIVVILLGSFLRLYKLTSNPPSLFGDELDLGYQAYSILHTARDYQGNFLPIHFHSIAEWRTPLYLYSAVPTVAVFGITPLGVRLPAAVFGILGIFVMFLLVKEITKNENLAILSSFLLAISQWDLQYSRAGFEVTEMLFLLILGLWLFYKSLGNGKWLWLSVILLVLTPWVYSTAKFFTPLLLVFLFITYRKEILSFKVKYNIYAIIAGLIVGVPIAVNTFFGGGTQRIGDISVFADPNAEQTVNDTRGLDQKVGIPSLENKLINNKFIYWGDEIVTNYFRSYSTDFLFLKGDLNLRQSVGMGELYRIEILPLVLGVIFFFVAKDLDKRIKFLVGFWVLVGAIPAALTVGGGDHATRLILMLPPLILLVSFGWVSFVKIFSAKFQKPLTLSIIILYTISILFYLHEYYVAYPWNSERWWHYGWTPAVQEVKSIDGNYNRVIISMAGEPAWIFFAANYEYPPALWQKEYPIGNDINVDGFGKISHTGKFYFGSPDKSVQIYGLGRYINSKTLYLSNASEVGANLILHPDQTPPGLNLIKAIPFPSGEPAFYLFSGEK